MRRGRFEDPVGIKDLESCPSDCYQRSNCSQCIGEPGRCVWCQERQECFQFSEKIPKKYSQKNRLRKQISIFLTLKAGLTPLHWACMKGTAGIIEIFIKMGSEIDVIDLVKNQKMYNILA